MHTVEIIILYTYLAKQLRQDIADVERQSIICIVLKFCIYKRIYPMIEKNIHGN